MAVDYAARLEPMCRDKRLPEDLRERIAIKLEQQAGRDVLAKLWAECRRYARDRD